MRTLGYILSLLALSAQGCFTQTNITRTVTHADGRVERYENRSNGYGYNPNFTGHYDSYTHTSASSFVRVPPPMTDAQPGQFGQYTIR